MPVVAARPPRRPSSHGVVIIAHANEEGVTTQTGAIIGNAIDGNGGSGVFLKAAAFVNGTTKQTFDLTNNTVANNGPGGVYLYGRNFNATQVVTLTTSTPGNQITSNGGWGVLLQANGNAHQTFNANSTQIGGAGPNLLSPNGDGTYSLGGSIVNQDFNK